MSRVAKSLIKLPSGVELKSEGQKLSVKGPKGELSLDVHELVSVAAEDGSIKVSPKSEDQNSWALAGTTRSLVNNMVIGVSVGYQKKLDLVGVGYRAQAKGNIVNLTLGFSHPVEYELPTGVNAETPTQTEILLSSIDKQLLGQTAANIRAFRPPEPYKGKGVRYSNEQVRRKEAKKK